MILRPNSRFAVNFFFSRWALELGETAADVLQ
jgi:hypothetical protein